MPLLGQKARFAVEYVLEDNPEGEWLLGRMCYWCGGFRVGDFELVTSLRDFLNLAERILCDVGNRSSARFTEMPAERVRELLSSAFFGHDGSGNDLAEEVLTPLSELAIEEQWARHRVWPPTIVFNDWIVFLVEDAACGRLLVFSASAKRTMETTLSAGEFDAVLGIALRELNLELERATLAVPP